MNAYTIYLKSGMGVTVYTPRKWGEGVTGQVAGCPILSYANDGLSIDLTLNQQNQLKWANEQQELMTKMSEFDSTIRQRAFQAVCQKLEIEERAKQSKQQPRLVVPE